MTAPIVAIVEKYPFGTVHHNLCVADVFTKDTLTISCPDLEDREMAVYGPDRWRSVVVLDSHGNVLYGHINESMPDAKALDPRSLTLVGTNVVRRGDINCKSKEM